MSISTRTLHILYYILYYNYTKLYYTITILYHYYTIPLLYYITTILNYTITILHYTILYYTKLNYDRVYCSDGRLAKNGTRFRVAVAVALTFGSGGRYAAMDPFERYEAYSE